MVPAIILIIAIALLITGGLVQSLNFLLWVGVLFVVLAIVSGVLGRRKA